MSTVSAIGKWILALAFVGAALYALFVTARPLLVPPCEDPLAYSIGTIDPRFNISEGQLRLALAHAAQVWNTASEKTLIEAAPQGEKGIPISLVYSDIQKTTELGKNIDTEQAAYDAKKAEVNDLRDEFSVMKANYELRADRYDAAVKAYQADVAYWNARGGAPADEYQKLNAQNKELDKERRALNEDADEVNAFAKKINTAVNELNALARKINAKVGVYNKNAGTDFEQGHYAEENGSKRIDVYEFKNTADLERVLAHEFGHALGMGHVENPDSIMYSFNIGTSLIPSAEDVAELINVCRLANTE